MYVDRCVYMCKFIRICVCTGLCNRLFFESTMYAWMYIVVLCMDVNRYINICICVCTKVCNGQFMLVKLCVCVNVFVCVWIYLCVWSVWICKCKDVYIDLYAYVLDSATDSSRSKNSVSVGIYFGAFCV